MRGDNRVMRRSAAASAAVIAMLGAGAAHAQRGMNDWMTTAYDAQRSSWVRSDNKISPESLRKPGFDLAWKLKFDNAARGLNNITPPALLDFYIGYRGFRTFGFFGGSSNRVITVDTDLARVEWEKNLGTGTAPAATNDCPGGMTSAVTRPTYTAYPAVPTGRGTGRGSPAKSGVGLPHEGAVTLRATPAPPPPPRRVAGAKPVAEEPSPFAPRVQYAVALTGDGKLHSLYVSNGNEPNPPVQFLPPNAHAQGLMVFGNTAYVATGNRCGGVDNGVWSLDLAGGKVNHWKAAGNVAGSAGPAAGPDGTLYIASGAELTSLAARTLTPLGSYKTGGAIFSSSPVVFEFKGKDLIAATTADGRLHLLDAAALNSTAPLDRSAEFSSRDFAAGSVTSWQDFAGTRWVLAPAGGAAAAGAGFPVSNGAVTNGAVAAWRVVEKSGKPALEPAWVSRDLVSPLPPIVVSGVVFALSSGESRGRDGAGRSSNAILYALDGATGKELWNSGAAMTSFVHSGGLAAGGTRVYVSTYDGTQYAFGFPIEH